LEENYNKVRIGICYKCSYKKVCVGIPKDYIELFSEEEFALN
jgi:hypothetical protein